MVLQVLFLWWKHVASMMSAYEKKAAVENLSLQNHQFDCRNSDICGAYILVAGTFDGHAQ